MALACTAGIVVVVNRFDSSFHTPGDVVDGLGIPVLAYVPKEKFQRLINANPGRLILPRT
jgi:capsular polysaccharide biosynthesis protein